MTVKILGWVEDFKPLVFCRIAAGNEIDDWQSAIECKALIDSGATDVIVRPEDVVRFGLRPTGEEVFSHNVGFAGSAAAYRVNISFPGMNEAGRPAWYTATNARALAFPFGQAHDIILGMNVLRAMDLHILSVGQVELNYNPASEAPRLPPSAPALPQ